MSFVHFHLRPANFRVAKVKMKKRFISSPHLRPPRAGSVLGDENFVRRVAYETREETFFFVLIACRGVVMVAETDLKSVERKLMRVRLPPPAHKFFTPFKIWVISSLYLVIREKDLRLKWWKIYPKIQITHTNYKDIWFWEARKIFHSLVGLLARRNFSEGGNHIQLVLPKF